MSLTQQTRAVIRTSWAAGCEGLSVYVCISVCVCVCVSKRKGKKECENTKLMRVCPLSPNCWCDITLPCELTGWVQEVCVWLVSRPLAAHQSCCISTRSASRGRWTALEGKKKVEHNLIDCQMKLECIVAWGVNGSRIMTTPHLMGIVQQVVAMVTRDSAGRQFYSWGCCTSRNIHPWLRTIIWKVLLCAHGQGLKITLFHAFTPASFPVWPQPLAAGHRWVQLQQAGFRYKNTPFYQA